MPLKNGKMPGSRGLRNASPAASGDFPGNAPGLRRKSATIERWAFRFLDQAPTGLVKTPRCLSHFGISSSSTRRFTSGALASKKSRSGWLKLIPPGAPSKISTFSVPEIFRAKSIADSVDSDRTACFIYLRFCGSRLKRSACSRPTTTVGICSVKKAHG